MLPAFTPERSVEDILSGRLRLVFGGQVFDLPVLSRAENRRWRESLELRFQSLLAVDTDDVETTLAALIAAEDDLLPYVASYDKSGVLPPIEELEELARPHEVLKAVAEVRAAANPLLGVGLAMAQASTTPAKSPPARSSSSRRRTAGNPTKSKR
jgi:hypothetical protein